MLTSESLWFVGPRQLEVRRVELAPLRPGYARVRAIQSAISTGTELLAFRGDLAADLALDAHLGALAGTFCYPFRYGYACVGVIEALNADPSQVWQIGQRVFAFHPHASRFDLPLAELVRLPPEITDDAALFLANMETAVTVVLDAAPLLGERVAVIGQGVVGRLVSALLHRFPLATLCAIDLRPERLAWAKGQGITSGWPQSSELFDLIVEVSGAPAALQSAIDHCDIEGRVVVASWYGEKTVNLALGQSFHRRRIRLISSQVSTLPGTLSQAWSRARRWELAATLLRSLDLHSWISHRLPLARAHEAYLALCEGHLGWDQVALTYA